MSRSTVAASSASAEARVVGADGVGVGVALLLVVRARAVERDGAVGGRRLARLEHLLERRRRCARRSRPASARGRARATSRRDAVDLHRQLLQVARHAHGPALVAEVALELAEDRRDGERRERRLARGVEAVDRLEQAERRDLDRGRRAARRRAGSGARAGARAAGSAPRAARARPGRPRGGSGRAAADPPASGRRGPPVVADAPLRACGALLRADMLRWSGALFDRSSAFHANHHAAAEGCARRGAGARRWVGRVAGPDRRAVYRAVPMATRAAVPGPSVICAS